MIYTSTHNISRRPRDNFSHVRESFVLHRAESHTNGPGKVEKYCTFRHSPKNQNQAGVLVFVVLIFLALQLLCLCSCQTKPNQVDLTLTTCPCLVCRLAVHGTMIRSVVVERLLQTIHRPTNPCPPSFHQHHKRYDLELCPSFRLQKKEMAYRQSCFVRILPPRLVHELVRCIRRP